MAFPMSSTYFNEQTWKEFLKGGSILHHEKKTTLPPGTRVLCNILNVGIGGIVELGAFPGTTSVCREASLLDPDVYSGDFAKNNKYEYGTTVLKIFDPPIPYSELADLCGIDNSNRNNITKNTHLTYRKLFYDGPDQDTVLRRVEIWIRHMIA